MARPLRIEFANAVYHVTCRGHRREDIFRSRADRFAWLAEMEKVCERFHFLVHCYCQMTNHFHLLVETPEGNLGQGMRQLNSAYSQSFNRRHELVGAVMQGRYKAILVQKETYLLELARYIALNPVRAAMVDRPESWPWSSHRFMLGQKPAPSWLNMHWLLSQFGLDEYDSSRAYESFVLAGIGKESPLCNVSHQCLLGSEEFIEQCRKDPPERASEEIARNQRRALAKSLAEYALEYPQREHAMAAAYRSTAFTMSQIAVHFGVTLKTVSRAIAAIERSKDN